MKKLFLILFAVFSLLFITACGSDSNKEENNDHRDGTVTSSVISVYDEEMNMVGSYSYSDTVNNTIDVSAFQKEGYKFDGIFDINLGIFPRTKDRRLMCQDGSNDIQLEVQYGKMLPDLSEYFKDTI